MPILGQEQPVLFSMDEVFNPTTANMLLEAQRNYGNILRQDYKEEVDDLKAFNKEFGNFLSRSDIDTQYFYDNTLGGISKMYDKASEAGIDLLRSAEGRSMLRNYIATRPYGELAKRRKSAEVLEEYSRNLDDLKKKNLYNEDFNRFLLGDINVANWDTSKNGIFNVSSPYTYQDIQQSTHHLFDKMELSYDKAASDATGGKYDVYSKDRSKMRAILDANFDDYIKTPNGQYQLHLVGGNREALKNEIINRNLQYTQEKREVNPLHLEEVRFGHDVALENLRHRHAMEASADKGGGGNYIKDMNVFDVAKYQGHSTFSADQSTNLGVMTKQREWQMISYNSKGVKGSMLKWDGKGGTKPKIVTINQNGKILPITYSGKNSITVTNTGNLIYKNTKGRDRWFLEVLLQNESDGNGNTTRTVTNKVGSPLYVEVQGSMRVPTGNNKGSINNN